MEGLRTEEVTRQRLGRAALALGNFGPFGSGKLWGKSELRWGYCQFTRNSEKEVLGDRFKGSAQDELPMPVASWLQVLWGTLEFRRCMSMKEDEGEGEGGERASAVSFLLRVLQAGSLERGLGMNLSRIFISCSKYVLSASWSPLIRQHQGRKSLIISADPSITHLPLLLPWA